jgi:hypothetical protein
MGKDKISTYNLPLLETVTPLMVPLTTEVVTVTIGVLRLMEPMLTTYISILPVRT